MLSYKEAKKAGLQDVRRWGIEWSSWPRIVLREPIPELSKTPSFVYQLAEDAKSEMCTVEQKYIFEDQKLLGEWAVKTRS